MVKYQREEDPHVFRCTECRRYFCAWWTRARQWREKPADANHQAGLGICQECVAQSLAEGAVSEPNPRHPWEPFGGD